MDEGETRWPYWPDVALLVQAEETEEEEEEADEEDVGAGEETMCVTRKKTGVVGLGWKRATQVGLMNVMDGREYQSIKRRDTVRY